MKRVLLVGLSILVIAVGGVAVLAPGIAQSRAERGLAGLIEGLRPNADVTIGPASANIWSRTLSVESVVATLQPDVVPGVRAIRAAKARVRTSLISLLFGPEPSLSSVELSGLEVELAGSGEILRIETLRGEELSAPPTLAASHDRGALSELLSKFSAARVEAETISGRLPTDGTAALVSILRLQIKDLNVGRAGVIGIEKFAILSPDQRARASLATLSAENLPLVTLVDIANARDPMRAFLAQSRTLTLGSIDVIDLLLPATAGEPLKLGRFSMEAMDAGKLGRLRIEGLDGTDPMGRRTMVKAFEVERFDFASVPIGPSETAGDLSAWLIASKLSRLAVEDFETRDDDQRFAFRAFKLADIAEGRIGALTFESLSVTGRDRDANANALTIESLQLAGIDAAPLVRADWSAGPIAAYAIAQPDLLMDSAVVRSLELRLPSGTIMLPEGSMAMKRAAPEVTDVSGAVRLVLKLAEGYGQRAAGLGFETIDLGYRFDARTDLAAKTLTIRSVDLDLKDAFELAVTLSLDRYDPRAAVPRAGTEDPAKLQLAAFSLFLASELRGLSVTLRDRSLTERLLTHFAETQGLEPDRARADLLEQLAEAKDVLAPSPGRLATAFQALEAFIRKPAGLAITVAPEKPIGMASLSQLATLPAADAAEALKLEARYTP